jgi:nitrogen-specific signal transduction histidine kinase
MDSEEKINNTEDNKKIALRYMETLVDVAREPFLILDADLRVIAANSFFVQTFKVTKDETLNVLLYKLGNGQWNIPELRKLLEEVLPEKKIVRDFEVEHVFETIGKKTMLVNARQIDSVQLIIIAIEDFTTRKKLEKKLANNAKKLETKVEERTTELTDQIKKLEVLNKIMVNRELKMVELKKEIENLKRKQHHE